jgi:predicted DNA-binding transcriptional regulator YafY
MTTLLEMEEIPTGPRWGRTCVRLEIAPHSESGRPTLYLAVDSFDVASMWLTVEQARALMGALRAGVNMVEAEIDR